MKKNNSCFLFRLVVVLLLCTMLLPSCRRDDYTPKPKAYLRFDFPEKDYTLCDTVALPFSFERAVEAQLLIKKNTPYEKYIDILYPAYRGVVFLTYKPLCGLQDLAGQVDTSYSLLKMHFDYSSGVEEQRFVNPVERVYGTTYHIKGSNVASTYQFWLTDSTRHFLRGSLYLDHTPNNDSLAPVLAYLQHDLEHFIETLSWR